MNPSRCKILIVEDEEDIRDLIALHLKRVGYEVEGVGSAEAALMVLKGTQKVHLMILDWMLPGLSGIDLIKLFRADKSSLSVPILMMTARTSSQDVVAGLQAGADDYLTKPFEIPVLLARVEALLRRMGLDNTTKMVLGDLVINTESYEVMCCGEVLQLTPSEYRLVLALAQNKNKVLSRDQLIQLVQGEGVSVVDRAIDTHVFGLRKKLSKCSEMLETVRGVGYRIRTE